MKRFLKIFSLFTIFLALGMLLSSCEKNSDWRPNKIKTNADSDSLYVARVENLPEDFILGMDASAVPALEAGGVKYYSPKTD